MMFRGVITALVTPFKENGTIDYEALDNLVEFQIGEGINALSPMGTTGESPSVSHDENIDVIEKVIKKVDGRVPVIAGTGSNCTDEALRMTKLAKRLGADASLQVAPYYNKPTQEGLYKHFMTIADEVDIPLMVYNIMGRSAVNIETDTLMRLAQHPNIVAVKEASGDISQMMEVLRRRPGDFSVLSGDDAFAVPLALLGGDGVVSVSSNIIPKWMSEMVNSILKGDIDRGRTMHFELLPFFKTMFVETNPIPVKAALAMVGKITERYRLPLTPPSEKSRLAIRETLKGIGLL